MSPLARSLLALAALLAVVDASDRLYNCVTKTIGQKTSISIDFYPYHIPYPGGMIYVDPEKKYCPAGMHIVGEKITVCNTNPQRKEPEIDDPTYGQVQPVPVQCYDQSGCTSMITEYCGF